MTHRLNILKISENIVVEARYFAINSIKKRSFYIKYYDSKSLELDSYGDYRLLGAEESLKLAPGSYEEEKPSIFGDPKYILSGSRNKSSFVESDFSVTPIYTVAFPKKFGFLIFPKDDTKEHKILFRDNNALSELIVNKEEADSIYNSEDHDWALVPYTARYF